MMQFDESVRAISKRKGRVLPAIRLKVPVEGENVSRVQFMSELNQACIGGGPGTFRMTACTVPAERES
jgi:hypothetical protein